MTKSAWIRRMRWAAAGVCTFVAAGCLTGPNDPNDAVGEPVLDGEGVRDEFKYDWEQQTSPTETEPRFTDDPIQEETPGDEG